MDDLRARDTLTEVGTPVSHRPDVSRREGTHAQQSADRHRLQEISGPDRLPRPPGTIPVEESPEPHRPCAPRRNPADGVQLAAGSRHGRPSRAVPVKDQCTKCGAPPPSKITDRPGVVGRNGAYPFELVYRGG